MAYSNKEFQQANEETKLAILLEIAERISYKYCTSNSFRIDQDDMFQELSVVAWSMVNDHIPNVSLGFYIKALYNKAVDIYHKYKTLRNYEFESDDMIDALASDSGYMEDSSISNGDLNEDYLNKINKTVKSSDSAKLKGSYGMNSSDMISVSTMVDEILSMLDIGSLERKYVLIKLKMDGILDLIDYDRDLPEIKDVDFSELGGEYDAVLALGHYTSPKSGSWYGRKNELKNLIKQYLELV